MRIDIKMEPRTRTITEDTEVFVLTLERDEMERLYSLYGAMDAMQVENYSTWQKLREALGKRGYDYQHNVFLNGENVKEGEHRIRVEKIGGKNA